MPVQVQREARGVATIVIDRPGKLNALDSETLEALAGAGRALAGEDGLCAVVLRGAGDRAFAGGADIVEMAALDGPEAARAFITRVHLACDTMRRMPVPVIARLSGYVLGAGLELAASCDLRVADRTAVLGMPEVRIGLPSVVEAALLPRLIGWGRAARLLLTGEPIGADQACAWGLVEEVAEAGAIDAAIARLLDAILACGPRAVRAQKALMAAWEDAPIGDAVRKGIDYFQDSFREEEPGRMLAAHLAALRERKR